MQHEHDIADRNIERLLESSYKPEAIDPAFAKELQEKLLAAAQHRAGAADAAPAPSAPNKSVPSSQVLKLRRRLGWAMALAASLAGVFLVYHALTPRDRRLAQAGKRPGDYQNLEIRAIHELIDGLTPKPKQQVQAPKLIEVGATLVTKAGERRRLTLQDGSVIYLNQNTEIQYPEARQVVLPRGEVFVEVSPRPSGSGETFRVRAPGRTVAALGTRFAVQADPQGSGVLVTQGRVKVDGLKDDVLTGQQVNPGQKDVVAAPRASHLLDWTRDLMIAAESPLVPCPKHGGGALVALDPFGQEVQLTLRKYHIDVHIEDGFARTTIDQTYFNNTHAQMEGTFYFPLPPDASLSRLAMYVAEGDSAKLMEGGMAERNHARAVYETIRYQRRDPALLEWVDGSTFKMRVFPLEARTEKRIILSYSQRLNNLYGAMRYRFPGGHNMELVKDWSFQARVRHGADLRVTSDSHPGMEIKKQLSDMVLTAAAKAIKPNKDVTVEIFEPDAQAADQARFNTFVHDNHRYMMLRYRPDLKAQPSEQKRHWVVLFETGANRDPLLARAQIDVFKGLLENVEHDDTFVLATANTRVCLLTEKPLTATKKNIDDAVKLLDKAHLIGALDLEKALTTLKPHLVDNAHLLHIGAGIPAMGERKDEVLAKLLPEHVHYVGVGVGKRWNRTFMKLAAERTGGFFTQINPDEGIDWRTFDLLATLNTPRLMDLKVLDAAEKVPFLTDVSYLAQGEELCAMARIDPQTMATPAKVLVTGQVAGKPYVREFKVENMVPDAGYLPRSWAKLEIDRLLAEGTDKNKDAVTKLSMAMYVMSPFTSLLVLETEEQYKQFKVDRGRKDHWALYECPQRIPNKYEADPQQAAWAPPPPAGQRKAHDVLNTILIRPMPQFVAAPGQPNRGATPFMSALQMMQSHPVGSGANPMGGPAWPGFNWYRNTNLDMFWTAPPDSVSIDPAATEMNALVQFRVERLGEVSVPGLVDPMHAVGILAGERWMTPLNLPAPGGLGWMGPNGQVQFAPVFVNPQMQWATPSGFGMLGGNMGGTGGPAVEQSGQTKGGGMPAMEGRLGLMPGVNFRTFTEDFSGLFEQPMVESQERNKDKKARIGNGPRGMTPMNRFLGRVGLGEQKMEALKDLTLDDMLGELRQDGNEVAGNDEWLQNITSRLLVTGRQPMLLYQAPTFTAHQQLFHDLTIFAPGLHTSGADIQATLDKEADEKTTPIGAIDPAAKAMIDRARQAGWSTITIPGKTKTDAYQVTFNGLGQFVLSRTLPSGLREKVVCDGQSLYHLYPELGLAGQRAFSRHHFEQLNRLVPWALPRAEDLARGADLKKVDDKTLAIIPRGQTAPDAEGKATATYREHLVFAADGRLTERQFVEMPAGKILGKQTYAADGTVKAFVTKAVGDKVLAEIKLARTDAKAPGLKAPDAGLLTMRFPLRTRVDVYQKLHGQEKWDGNYSRLATANAEDLFVAECLQGNAGVALAVFGERFHSQKDHRLGFYVLLAAANALPDSKQTYNWTNAAKVRFQPALEHQDHPLVPYLEQWRRQQERGGIEAFASDIPGPKNGFIQRLAEFRHLYHQWNNDQAKAKGGESYRAARERTVKFLQENQHGLLNWALLDVINRQGRLVDFTKEQQTVLTKATFDLTEEAGLVYAARYDSARHLLNSGQNPEARKMFLDLYEEVASRGGIPQIEDHFRRALNSQAKNDADQPFAQFIRDQHRRLMDKQRPHSALLLAWQMHQLSDQPLANELFNLTLTRTPEKNRDLVVLTGMEFLWQTGQLARADVLLQKLLENPLFNQRAAVWRLSATLAGRRGQLARSVAALEKAMDLEFRHMPDMINLQVVRHDYRSLLTHYQQLATALTVLDSNPPKDFLAKVVKAADRWRSLDGDNPEMCQLAANILQLVGARELAWDYLTTPIGMKPNEAAPWLQLATSLQGEAEYALADRAYIQAFEAEATNAEILWNRAQNLQQMGRVEDARQVYRQIVNGTWQERFQGVQQQARAYLANP